MRFWGGLFLLAAALNVALGAHAWPAVFAGSLNDPDSYMRLERIAQGIHAGHLTNIVARDDSGAGVLVEWSRLFDTLIWALAAPLALLCGWGRALFATGVALGPAGVGCLGLALAYAAEPFAARRFLWAAPVAAAVLPGLLTFAAPGVVHYHILLLAALALTAGFAARAAADHNLYAFFTGVAGGVAIWLTPETMPFVLMIFGGFFINWLRRPSGPAIVICAAGFSDLLGFALAMDPPVGGFAAVEIDRLSIVYAALALGLLAAATLQWRLQRRLPGARRRGLAAAALLAACILAWVGAYPGVALGPYGLMSAEDMRRFFGVMLELQPLAGAPQVVAFLLPGCIALGYALWRAAQRGFGAWLWLYLAVCTLVSLVLADRFILFTEFPAGIAAALLPVMLTDVSARLAAPRPAMLARLGLLAAMLLAPLLPGFAKPAPAGGGADSCSLRRIGGLLAPAAGRVVLTEPSDTPEILYRTQVETVGSLYQHGVPAYLRARAAWRAAPGTAEPPEVAASGADYVLFCAGEGRSLLVADLPPETLWDALLAGRPPPWLTPAGRQAGWVLYKIRHG